VDHKSLVIKQNLLEKFIQSTAQLDKLIMITSSMVFQPERLKLRFIAKKNPSGLIHKTPNMNIAPTILIKLISRTKLTHVKQIVKNRESLLHLIQVSSQHALLIWIIGIRLALLHQLLEDQENAMINRLYSFKLHV